MSNFEINQSRHFNIIYLKSSNFLFDFILLKERLKLEKEKLRLQELELKKREQELSKKKNPTSEKLRNQDLSTAQTDVLRESKSCENDANQELASKQKETVRKEDLNA